MRENKAFLMPLLLLRQCRSSLLGGNSGNSRNRLTTFKDQPTTLVMSSSIIPGDRRMVTVRMEADKIHPLVGIPKELDRWKSWVVVGRRDGFRYVIFLYVFLHLSVVGCIEGAVVKVCTGWWFPGLLWHCVDKRCSEGGLKKMGK